MSQDRLSRRKLIGLAATGAAMIPLDGAGFLRLPGATRQVLVPADKGFTKQWLNDLSRRGTPTRYRGKALENIAMPIGGIGCGQVYLSGDGRLTYWDIFNGKGEADISGPIQNGLHYSSPIKPASPFNLGFQISLFEGTGVNTNALTQSDFADAEFEGRYPMASVKYAKNDFPLEIELDAYSPFIPLNPEDSSLPVAVMSYRVTNTSAKAVDFEIVGFAEDPCCLYSRTTRPVESRTSQLKSSNLSGFFFSPQEPTIPGTVRPDFIFEDFEGATYGKWTVEGTAFGDGPVAMADIPKYQGNVLGVGKQVVNAHNSRHGEDVVQADAHQGRLLSPAFEVAYNFISMLVGGGKHPGQTCVNLLLDGKVARTATGHDSNEMAPVIWDVRELRGKSARIEILDHVSGPWGNIGVDQIVFTDQPSRGPLSEEPDFGEFGIALLGSSSPLHGFKGKGIAVGKRVKLKPKESTTVTFLVAWHFPNINRRSLGFLQGAATLKRHYAGRFKGVSDLLDHVATNFKRLDGQTRLWTKTWYDSTLPYWFLDRTMANTSTLSTSTCYWFDSGRFYGWEGVYCCAGTCSHVWQYAHAVGRLFPQLERDTRLRIDYGIAFHPNGAIDHRAEAWEIPATDGQCGTILRVYREHQMSQDDKFLKAIWPRVKKSIEFMIAQDPNLDGILEGAQFNTLDATWHGKIAWISGLYCAALRAGEVMAAEMGDSEFAHRCGKIAENGSEQLVSQLFNGEYFIQRVDPAFPKSINTNDGCHIDQVLGQSWAHQVGLPRIIEAGSTKKALHSIFKYNFAPDVGKYRAAMKDVRGGRWYALPGEAGLLMCTWPKGGADKSPGEGQADFAVGYFNECMTGFEHQVAANMLSEGMVEEGLAIERTIHERYDAHRRNPYNEIECSDHYARAMASYGVFIAACGFTCHTPMGHLTFKPNISPEDFRAPFTNGEAWGTFSQKIVGNLLTCQIEVKYGTLQLRKLSLQGVIQFIRASGDHKGQTASPGDTIEFDQPVTIEAGHRFEVTVETHPAAER